MQPGEALGVAAQVAVTLAGFAGIVVVFRPESVHRWLAQHCALALTPAWDLRKTAPNGRRCSPVSAIPITEKLLLNPGGWQAMETGARVTQEKNSFRI
jgi:hypothetical protein